MDVADREKLGQVAAEQLDDLEALQPDDHPDGPIVSVRVEEVISVVELAVKTEDGEEYCQVRIKSSHESPVYKRGLLESAIEVLVSDPDDDD